MNRLCKKFLSAACFSGQKHVLVAFGREPANPNDFTDSGARSDQIVKRKQRPCFIARSVGGGNIRQRPCGCGKPILQRAHGKNGADKPFMVCDRKIPHAQRPEVHLLFPAGRLRAQHLGGRRHFNFGQGGADRLTNAKSWFIPKIRRRRAEMDDTSALVHGYYGILGSSPGRADIFLGKNLPFFERDRSKQTLDRTGQRGREVQRRTVQSWRPP